MPASNTRNQVLSSVALANLIIFSSVCAVFFIAKLIKILAVLRPIGVHMNGFLKHIRVERDGYLGDGVCLCGDLLICSYNILERLKATLRPSSMTAVKGQRDSEPDLLAARINSSIQGI